MQKKFNKWIWLVVLLLIIGAFLLSLYQNMKVKEYTKNLFYMDTYIYVKIYEKNEKKANKALNEIEKMYDYYHKLTDRYQAYDGVENPYTIFHNTKEDEYLSLDPNLYQILAYAKEWYQKTNGKVDITMGSVIDVWKKYREEQTGIPTLEKLNIANTGSMDNLILLEDNKIVNNHPNLDLGAIAKGYTTQMVGEYLESIGISYYLINAGGNVKVGKSYKDFYTIGLEDPKSQVGEIFKVVHGQNISVITSGGYERFYEYHGKKYHHIIDPDTLFPSDYYRSVTIITKDSKLGDILSTALFLMPLEEGKELIESLDGCEAIWYTTDDLVVSSSGMDQYE